MRFRDRATPATQPVSRRDRSRVVRLVFALLVVMLGIQVAADPATWAWMFPTSPPAAGGPTLADVSYAVELTDNAGIRPDAFRSVAVSAPAPAAVAAEPSRRLIEPALLVGVKDNTLTLSAADRIAIAAILRQLKAADPAALQAAADTAVSYPVLNVEPAHYRGRVVEIEGRARRITQRPAITGEPAALGEASDGDFYDVWVFTPESGNNPWHVISASMAAGLPVTEWLPQGVPVRLCGVFLKQEGYETTQGELHVAPLLLTARVDAAAVSPVGPAPEAADFAPWIVGGLLALLVGSVLVWAGTRAADRRFERTTLRRFAPRRSSDAAPADLEPIDPVEFLRSLQEPSEAISTAETTADAAPIQPIADTSQR